MKNEFPSQTIHTTWNKMAFFQAGDLAELKACRVTGGLRSKSYIGLKDIII